jgi:hypothetical protein
LQFAPKATTELQQVEVRVKVAQNYYINKYFDVEGYNEYLHLTAKEVGANYTIRATDITCDGIYEGSSTYAPVAGVDAVANNLFKIFVSLYAASIKTYELNIEPDEDGDVVLDVSPYLLPHVSSSFVWPQDVAALMTKKTDYIKTLTLQYAENYGTPPTIQKPTTYNGTFRFVNGGVSAEKFKQYQILNTNWFTRFANQLFFLTNRPHTINVRVDQPEFLYFLNYNVKTTIKLVVDIHYADGTTELYYPWTESGTAQYDVYEIVTTYNTIGLATKAAVKGSAITEYRVWVEDNASNHLSEKYRYVVETSPVLFDRYFIFKNSLGTYDTLRTTGLGAKNIKITSTTTKQYVSPESYTYQTRQKKQSNKLADVTFKVNTGLLEDKIMADYLISEFMISDDIYMVLGDYVYPVVLNTENSGVYEDDNYTFFGEFEVEMSFTEEAYTIPPDLAIIVAQSGGSFNRSFSDSFDTI